MDEDWEKYWEKDAYHGVPPPPPKPEGIVAKIIKAVAGKGKSGKSR